MTTTTVSSVSGLTAALAAAHNGDVIQLAAGTYANVSIVNTNFSGNVTITSADANNPAVIANLGIAASSGLTISGLEINNSLVYTPENYPFAINNSQRIVIANNDIHGSLDGDPTADASGLLVNGSSQITVSGNEFHEVGNGIVHTPSTNGLTVDGNYFHDVRTDGVHGSGSNVTITNNYFTDFHPAPGDHADTIQFFDEGDGTAPHDILIQGNVYERGSGSAVEGIFMAVADPLRFYNVTIKDNLYVGTTSHGISLAAGYNVNISGNSINSFGDYSSWIWINNSTNVTEANNSAATFIYGFDGSSHTATTSNTNISATGNTISPYVSDGGTALFNTWLTSHPSFTANLIGTSAAQPSTPVVTDPTPPVTDPTPPPSSGGSTTAPGGVVLNPGTDTGSSNSDGLTKMAVVKIDGVAAEGGSAVSILSDGAVVASGKADSAGNFSLSTSSLGEGDHLIRAQVKTVSGAVAVSDAITVTVDTTGPHSDIADFGLKATGRSASTVSLSGWAGDDHGVATTAVYRDGTLIKTVDSSSGGWSYSDAAAGNRAHTYTIKSTDAAGNVTAGDHALVIGTASAETLRGSTGADVIWGAGGYDTMTGGGGSDTFVFRSTADAPNPVVSRGRITSVEKITDFSTGDHIDLTGLGHLNFGGQSTVGHADTVNWYVSGGNTFIIADVTHDGRADMMIQLSGNHPLTASDFLLG